MTVPVRVGVTVTKAARPGQITIGIVVLDGRTYGFSEPRRFFLNVRPDILLVINKRHGLDLPFRKADKKDHNGIDKDGFDNDQVPSAVEKVFHLESLFKWKMLLDRGSIGNVL